MADQYSLDAQPRTVIGKQVKALRRQNLVPAVIYGAGGETMPITVTYRPLEIALSKAGGTHLIHVSVDGQVHNALVREVQRDKVKRTILHVDFLRVDLSKKLHATVPLTFVGVPKLASELQLSHNVASVEVECLPTDIPDHIEVDLTPLTTLGAQITVGDLPSFSGVTVLTDPHEVVARVDAMAAESAEDIAEAAAAEAAAAATPAEPEVIEKGKKEEEEF